MKVPPLHEPWFAEKSSSVVERLAQAVAASRQIEDEVLQKFIVGTLETALVQAIKITNAGLYGFGGEHPNPAHTIAKDPDAAIAWLEEVRLFEKRNTGPKKPAESIVREVERVLEEARLIGS